jgi:TonB family protein
MADSTAHREWASFRSARVHFMTASNKVSARESGVTVAEKSNPGARRTEVVIVGAGDELLIEVGPALGDQYRSYSVDTAGEIADLSVSSWIGVYDASNHTAGRSAFAQLESQYHQQPWIVLCADEDRPNWRDVLSRGGACAVIARSELSVPTFTAALDKATQRLTIVPRGAAAEVRTTPKIPLSWMIGAAVVAVAAGAVWWIGHSRTHAPVAAVPTDQGLRSASGSSAPRTPAAATAAAQAAPQSVEDLLSMARIAFRDPAAQLPKPDVPLQGTSALELYGAVLLQQPKNDEALDGVRRLQAVARLRVQNALASGDADTAARLLAILQHADFAPEELRALEAAVAAARPKQLAAQARSAMAAGNLQVAHQLIDQLLALNGERSPVPELRKELDARKLDAELAADAEQVRAALTAGSLLEPETDNARTRFLAMRELNRTSPQTLAVQHELLLALLRRVQAAIGRQDLDGAQQTLTIAQDFGSKAELADTRGNLDAATSARRVAEAAAAAAKAARASAPVADAKAAAASTIILSPKPTRNLQVDFPPSALAQNIQGYAIVEFTLNPNGSSSAATIIESAPRSTFDSAALAAVKRATFSTKDLADPKKAQRARFKINFTLGDTAAPATVVSKPAPPAATNPVAPGGAPSNPLQVLSPRPTQPLQVDYPKVALALNRTGYVVVEFMLNPDGTPGSPSVVESVPAKVFDYEALVAVKRAKFVTTDLADPTKPQRAHVKISFKGQ